MGDELYSDDYKTQPTPSYFSKDGHQGVCAFRRVKSTEQGHRGFRLSSLGVLLAKSTRPKPWRHVAALKNLMTMLYARMELTDTLQPTEDDWEATRIFFEEHKVKSEDLRGTRDWSGWVHELDGVIWFTIQINRFQF